MKIKLTNLAKGVLILPDLNNLNHVNIRAGESVEFTTREYEYYRKNVESRIRNGLLKHEVVKEEAPKEESKAPEETKLPVANASALTDDSDDEFSAGDEIKASDSSPIDEDETEEELAGLGDDEEDAAMFSEEELQEMDAEAAKKTVTTSPVSTKKKKKKNRNK